MKNGVFILTVLKKDGVSMCWDYIYTQTKAIRQPWLKITTHCVQGFTDTLSSKLLWHQYTILSTLILHSFLFFGGLLNHPQVRCRALLPFSEKWVYYILQELHWWSLVVWRTALINGNMNFAHTLYWLQIATTTPSNNSRQFLFFFLASPTFSFLTLSFFSFIYTWCESDHPYLKHSSFSSLSLHYKKIILRPTKLGQPHQHITSWQSLSAFESAALLWWMKQFARMNQMYDLLMI